MKAFRSVTTREEWGAFNGREFRLEDSARATFDSVGFTICQINNTQIAVVTEAIDSEMRERLASAARPPWLDAIGVVRQETPPNAARPRIVAEFVEPAGLDPFALAFASVCVLEDQGSFTVDVLEFLVQVGDQPFRVMMDADPETESRFGTVEATT